MFQLLDELGASIRPSVTRCCTLVDDDRCFVFQLLDELGASIGPRVLPGAVLLLMTIVVLCFSC